MTRNLLDILRELPPAGPDGFEGLIAQLLDALTGAHFTLAQTGSQEGRDISARQLGTNITAVECKRYRENTALDQRELLGEFSQVSESIPDLDVWVLVASRDVNSQLAEALQRAAVRQGVAFVAISAGDGRPSSLEVLCAQAPHILITHSGFLKIATSDEVLPQLEHISSQADFAQKVGVLRSKFTDPAVGLDSWRHSQNQRFLEILSSKRDSSAQFGQPINVVDKEIHLVPRTEVWTQVDEWLLHWETRHSPLVISGEEGDGKTWAIASWLSQRVNLDSSFPAILFLASTNVYSQEIETLLTRTITNQLPLISEEQAKRLLNRWMQRPAEAVPLFLVVFDGINERRTPEWWRTLFVRLTGSPWRERVGVIITCRTSYWQRNFNSLRSFSVDRIPLPPYDDTELNIALAQYNLNQSHIQNALLPIIRKPRYFDLMVQYRNQVTESGDVTIARLVYEDWRDRFERKVDTALTNEQFQQVIRQLVEAQEQRTILVEREVVDTLPVFSDKERIYEELRTGGILVEHRGRYLVDERLLVFGLGLLLVEQVEQSAKNGEDLRETIAQWLEPRSEMDIKAAICEYAALHVLQLADIAREAKVALLQAWADSRNVSDNTEHTITAYIPLDPETYTALAEVVWSEAHDNGWAQEILVQAFVDWYGKSPQVAVTLVTAFERWLGFVPLNGFYERQESDEERAKLRREMAERAGNNLVPGQFSFAGFSLTAVEDVNLTRLGRAALTIISHIPRSPFIRAITIGCIVEIIVGQHPKYDLFAWILATASEDIWPEVEKEVRKLLIEGSVVSQRAAYRLLSFEGREQAATLQATIPEGIFPKSPLHEEYLRDPCTSGFTWSAEVCEQCLQRTNLDIGWVARQTSRYCVNPHLHVPDYYISKFSESEIAIEKDNLWKFLGLTSEDHALEELEPLLLRFIPHKLADFLCSVAIQIRDRDGMARRQLAFRLSGLSLIFTEAHWEAIKETWEQLITSEATWGEAEETAEFVLYRQRFFHGTAEEHVAAMLRRPLRLLEETINRQNFLPVNDWGIIQQAFDETKAAEGVTRILWYLSAHPIIIPLEIMQQFIVPNLHHESSNVRTLALEIIYKSQNQDAIDAAINNWSWSPLYGHSERHWGSLVLSEYGKNLDLTDILRRIHPSYAGYAVIKRGKKPEDVELYAQLTHALWLRLVDEAPEPPDDLPDFTISSSTKRQENRLGQRSLTQPESRTFVFHAPNATWGGNLQQTDPFDEIEQDPSSFNEQQEALWAVVNEVIQSQEAVNNYWFSGEFYAEDVKIIIETHPEYAEIWLQTVLQNNIKAELILNQMSSFYHALCIALLDINPPQGITLYWRIRESRLRVRTIDHFTKFELLDHALFAATPNAEVMIAWQKRLEECTNNKEMMSVVLLAQYCNGTNWLEAYISIRLTSPIPIESARALTLIGFLNNEKTYELLNDSLGVLPETWVGDLASRSRQNFERNIWAKHWFRLFLTEIDDLSAWAAFRLFLRCIDGRYLLWHSTIQDEIGKENIPHHRMAFLLRNRDAIRSGIKENEKDLEGQLFSHKVHNRQVWPWM